VTWALIGIMACKPCEQFGWATISLKTDSESTSQFFQCRYNPTLKYHPIPEVHDFSSQSFLIVIPCTAICPSCNVSFASEALSGTVSLCL